MIHSDQIKNYINKYGIDITGGFDKYDPIQWWKWSYYGSPKGKTLATIPKTLYNENNIKKICRYVLEEELKYKERNDFLKLKGSVMQKYKIAFHHFKIIGSSPIRLLQFCYPEQNFQPFEMRDVKNNYWKNDENKIKAIDWFLQQYKFTLNDVLECKITQKISLTCFLATIIQHFNGYHDFWIWYYNKKGIEINVSDFKVKPKAKWTDENIINEVKRISEIDTPISIHDYIKNLDTDGLLNWFENHFKKNISISIITEKKISPYDLLITVYPEIKIKGILFKWELHRFKHWNDKNARSESLRELVLHKLKLNNLIDDIPKYINYSFLSTSSFSKLIRICQTYYGTQNFYQWCCDAFPELKGNWKEDDFGKVRTAFDGTKCNSLQELFLYEYIKTNFDCVIEAVGMKRSGKYIFKLPNNSVDNHYCPDFVITEYNGRKLKKPIIIEYFGFLGDFTTSYFVDYRNKMIRKNEYYNSLTDFHYLDVYKDDLKNNFYTLTEKLSVFFNGLEGVMHDNKLSAGV